MREGVFHEADVAAQDGYRTTRNVFLSRLLSVGEIKGMLEL